MAGSERNCVFRLRLPSVYQNKAAKHWGARDCGFGGARFFTNVYQKSTKGTSAARMSGFFAALEAFFNLFKPVTGVVQSCHPVSGNVFLLLPEKRPFQGQTRRLRGEAAEGGKPPRTPAPTSPAGNESGPCKGAGRFFPGQTETAGRAGGPIKAGAAGRSRH